MNSPVGVDCYPALRKVISVWFYVRCGATPASSLDISARNGGTVGCSFFLDSFQVPWRGLHAHNVIYYPHWVCPGQADNIARPT